MSAGVLERIVRRRRERLRNEGHALGTPLPARRPAPVVPFGGYAGGAGPGAGARAAPLLICEVKRRSPSRGEIAPGLNAADQAERYWRRGADAVSVLTEEDHFQGSLRDLIEVKARCPRLPVLRKDFLLDEEDLEVSWRAGADAVLLIASVLDPDTLRRLCDRAARLGLAVLLELHDETDVAKARAVRPAFTGINSRDLGTFREDPLLPLALRRLIDWDTTLVFESGIRRAEDALPPLAAGFGGLLVGEGAVRRPELVAELAGIRTSPLAARDFWGRLALRRRPGVPLVKVCGITRPADAERAAGLGADLVGFVFAESPRRADPALLRELRGLPALRVGVLAGEKEGAPDVPDAAARALLEEGLLDAVQLHGREGPEECLGLGWPYYKAVRPRSAAEAASAGRYFSPRVLVDAWSERVRGGTGRRVSADVAAAAAAVRPLWLAGGIGPENAGEVVRRFRPELIDASSRLEASPGIKDAEKLERFFREIATAAAEAAEGME